MLQAKKRIAIGNDAYVKQLEKEWLEIERNAIQPHLEDADVVILSACVPGEKAPVLITEQMVSSMKPGSVIMDISADQGGNCEVTEPGQLIQTLGVYVCGMLNFPGRMAMAASSLYTENMYYFLENLFKNGTNNIDLKDEIVENALVTKGGKILHRSTIMALALEETSQLVDLAIHQGI